MKTICKRRTINTTFLPAAVCECSRGHNIGKVRNIRLCQQYFKLTNSKKPLSYNEYPQVVWSHRQIRGYRHGSRISERERSTRGGSGAYSPGKFRKIESSNPIFLLSTYKRRVGSARLEDRRRHLKRGKWGGELSMKIIVGTQKGVQSHRQIRRYV